MVDRAGLLHHGCIVRRPEPLWLHDAEGFVGLGLVPDHGRHRHCDRLDRQLFLASSGLQFAISVIGVLVFAGLTAYDTQQIKEEYYAGDSQLVAGQKAIMGALRLYLDFLNMFLMLLSLFGNRE